MFDKETIKNGIDSICKALEKVAPYIQTAGIKWVKYTVCKTILPCLTVFFTSGLSLIISTVLKGDVAASNFFFLLFIVCLGSGLILLPTSLLALLNPEMHALERTVIMAQQEKRPPKKPPCLPRLEA